MKFPATRLGTVVAGKVARRLRGGIPVRGTTLTMLAAMTSAALVFTVPAEAQGHRPGRGPSGRAVVFVGGYYRPFFDPYAWYPYPWYPYQASVFPPYGVYGFTQGGSVRLQVTPRQAEVYVDGYLAGTVDDFDGFFQRLRVAPGAHDIALYLDGHHTVHQNLHLAPGGDYKVRHTMVPLGAGEPAEPRPVPAEVPQGSAPPVRPSGDLAPASRFGTLSIRVQPGDAEVLVDGKRWSGPVEQDRLVIQVSEGSHRIQVHRDGYQQFSTDVQARAGETATLNVSLPPLERR